MGMNATDAARGAGYSNNSAVALRVAGNRLANDPKIQRAAFEHREKRLQGPLANKAIATLEAVMDDRAAAPAARIQAAKFILEAAGHGLESRRLAARLPSQDDRCLADLSNAELESFVLEAMANKARAGRLGNGAVIDVTADADNTDNTNSGEA